MASKRANTEMSPERSEGCESCATKGLCWHRVDPQNSLLRRLAKQGIPPPRAVHLMKAYCHFLEIKIIEKDWDASLLSPSALVDLVWHEHILDTRAYVALNREIAGSEFIHHDPDGGNDDTKRIARVKRTLLAYRKHFHHNPEEMGSDWYQEAWLFPEMEGKRVIRVEFPSEGDRRPACNLVIDLSAPARTILTTLGVKRSTVMYVNGFMHNATETLLDVLGSSDLLRLLSAEDAARRRSVQRTTYPIFIKSLTSKQISIDIDTSEHGDYVFELKDKVYRQEGIPPDQIRLVYDRQALQDNDRLRLMRESTVWLVLKLSGC